MKNNFHHQIKIFTTQLCQHKSQCCILHLLAYTVRDKKIQKKARKIHFVKIEELVEIFLSNSK